MTICRDLGDKLREMMGDNERELIFDVERGCLDFERDFLCFRCSLGLIFFFLPVFSGTFIFNETKN